MTTFVAQERPSINPKLVPVVSTSQRRPGAGLRAAHEEEKKVHSLTESPLRVDTVAPSDELLEM